MAKPIQPVIVEEETYKEKMLKEELTKTQYKVRELESELLEVYRKLHQSEY